MQRKPLESILSEEDKNEKVLWEKGIKKRETNTSIKCRVHKAMKKTIMRLSFIRFNLGNFLKFSSSHGNNSPRRRNDDIKLLQRNAP